jgi:hypothetical protein
VSVREIPGMVFVYPLNWRGRPTRSSIVQRCQKALEKQRAAGIQVHVKWRDDGSSDRELRIRYAKVYPDGMVILPDCAVMTRMHP